VEIDFDDALWRIPAERMKMKGDHLVPLARQVKERLEALRELTGGGEFMFPAWSGGLAPMNPESLRRALNRLGYGPTALNGGHTPHGFRSAAATFLGEKGFPGDWVEIQLAHAERDKIVRAYNHALYVPQRREMMQAWPTISANFGPRQPGARRHQNTRQSPARWGAPGGPCCLWCGELVDIDTQRIAEILSRNQTTPKPWNGSWVKSKPWAKRRSGLFKPRPK